MVISREQDVNNWPIRRLAGKAFLLSLSFIFTVTVVPDGYTQSVVIAPGNNGNNRHYCQIMVINGGTLQPSVDNKKMSSREQRGLPGKAQLTATNSSFSLTVEKPLGFRISPNGGVQSLIFSTSISGTGATNFTETPGDFPVRIKRGMTEVSADLTVENLDGPFRSGKYEAEITLRCE